MSSISSHLQLHSAMQPNSSKQLQNYPLQIVCSSQQGENVQRTFHCQGLWEICCRVFLRLSGKFASVGQEGRRHSNHCAKRYQLIFTAKGWMSICFKMSSLCIGVIVLNLVESGQQACPTLFLCNGKQQFLCKQVSHQYQLTFTAKVRCWRNSSTEKRGSGD